MKHYYFLFIILLVTCVVYIPSLSNDFLDYWDDQWMVINEYTTGGWSFDNCWSIFTDFYYGQYAPFAELSFLIIYSICGYEPLGFHLASLLWHLGCICFLWKLIGSLLELHGGMSDNDIRFITIVTTLLFAIHPINVETIAWISAVKILIYAFFYLLGLLCYVQYIKTFKIEYYCAVIVCFLFSFFGKEQAVTFPIMLIVVDWFTHRDLKSKEVWNEKMIFFILGLFFGLITIFSHGYGSSITTYTLPQRLIFTCYAIFEYITKSLLPIQLNYLYPFPILPDEELPNRLFIYPILLICLTGWIILNRKNNFLVFGLLLFIINLIFSIHIFPMSRHAIVADRYLYLSYIGLAFLIAYGLCQLKRSNLYFRSAFFAFCVYVLFLSVYSYQYTHKWENTVSVKMYMKELLQKKIQ